MSKSEQPPIYMVRKGNYLIPEMEIDAELMERLPFGQQIKVTLYSGRSPSKLRWYWMFLGRVVKSTECAPSPETLHDIIKLHTGFVTPVMVKGFAVAVPKSISFSSMSEEEFETFRMSAIKWIAEIYHITPEDVFPEDRKSSPRRAA